MNKIITFDKSFTKFILESLGLKIDNGGYITNRGKRVKSISNEEIKLSEFGGVAKSNTNKWLFMKDNVFDMIIYVSLQEEGIAPRKMMSLKDLKKKVLINDSF